MKQKPKYQDSQWRKSYDYRDKFLESTPGIYNNIWFCAICNKPLIGKKKVQAGHIIAPSIGVMRNKRNGKIINETLAKALNTKLNVTAVCEHCNKSAGNKVGTVTLQGASGKSRETISKVVGDTVALGISLGYIAIERGVKLLAKPLTTKNIGMGGKFVVIAIIIATIYLLFFRG